MEVRDEIGSVERVAEWSTGGRQGYKDIGVGSARLRDLSALVQDLISDELRGTRRAPPSEKRANTPVGWDIDYVYSKCCAGY